VQPVADAQRAVLAKIATIPHLGIDTVPLADARGRVLAAIAIAPRPLPGFDNSAMDGYAVRAEDLPGTLDVIGSIAAGASWAGGEVPRGAAVRILTGAPMPPGTDTVVIQEDATRDGDRVALPVIPARDNVRRAGSDLAVGARAVAASTRLGPFELGLLAALGFAKLPVVRRPRVALIGTGDELVDVDVTPGPGQLVDSSAYALESALRDIGCEPVRLGFARDDAASTTALITRALEFDAIITTGGVSVGDRDLVRPVLEAAGVTLELWKVAMKPGKPFAFGMRGSTAVFALPGNPVSTMVGFELFVRPALLALQGVPTAAAMRPRVPVTLRGAYAKTAGRAHYLTSRIERDGERLIAIPHPVQGSAMLSSLIGCSALVEISADATTVADGAACTAILLEAV
jgi:molybdopterin molybdotransferase